MSIIVMDKKEELIMRLVHYFITEENYNPIVVNGVKDEISSSGYFRRKVTATRFSKSNVSPSVTNRFIKPLSIK